MHRSLRSLFRPASSASSERALSLIAARDAHLRARVQFRARSYHAELRGGALVLEDSRSRAVRAFMLSENRSELARVGASAIRVSRHHVLKFANAHTADAWYARLLSARFSESRPKRYRTLRAVGSGASGNVYVVEDLELRKTVAMKAIPKASAFRNEKSIRNICQERLALEQGTSSKSVFLLPLLDAFQTKEYLYLVTELAQRGDLHRVLNSMPEHRLSEEAAKELFAELILGLKELHALGYLYRDLKAENVMISAEGHVQLGDFGLVKRMRVADGGKLLGRASTFVGTRRYMAPELVSGTALARSGYGAPADLWALGVTLYKALTGFHPFGNVFGSDDVDVEGAHGAGTGLFQEIREGKLRFPSSVSDDARSILKGLLEKDVAERMDLNEAMTHPWMKDVDWQEIERAAKEKRPGKLAAILPPLIEPVEDERTEDAQREMKHLSAELERRESKKEGRFTRRTKSDHSLHGFGYLPYSDTGPDRIYFEKGVDNQLSFSDCSVST